MDLRIAAVVNEKDVDTAPENVWEKAVQLNNGPLTMPAFSQCHTDFLEQGYIMLEGFREIV